MSGAELKTLRATLGVTVLVLLAVWESIHPFLPLFARDVRGRTAHAGRNLALGVINGVAGGLLCASCWGAAAAWAEHHRFGVFHWLTLPEWARLAGTFVLVDLWLYAWHRLNHAVPLLWRFHRVHHSDPRMDVTTASRFHVVENLLGCGLRAPVIALLGTELWQVAVYELVMFSVVQLHHANVSLGARVDRFLRLLIVTPFVHKVHHSDRRPETDSNFASLFSFWDRLFGTFRLREDPGTLQFGLEELRDPRHHTVPGLLRTPWQGRAGTDGPERDPRRTPAP